MRDPSEWPILAKVIGTLIGLAGMLFIAGFYVTDRQEVSVSVHVLRWAGIEPWWVLAGTVVVLAAAWVGVAFWKRRGVTIIKFPSPKRKD